MRKLLGHLAPSAILAVLLVATGTPVARAASIYEITVTIDDLTTSTVTSFVIDKGDPNDTNPSAGSITADGAFLTASSAASGITFSSLSADSSSTSSATQLNAHATFSLNPGVSDHYLVTIMTTHDTYTLPPAASAALLSQSESGTYTFTTAGHTQKSDTYYSPTNTANSTADGHTGVNTILIPATGMNNASMATGTLSTVISPYVTPYALTNLLIVDIAGTGSADNSVVQANSASTLTSAAVPEPTTIVMVSMGMPLSLVFVHLLRRHRRRAAA